MKQLIITFLFVVSSLKIIYGRVTEKDIYDFINQVIEINNLESLSKKAKFFDIGKPSQNEFIGWWIKK